MLSKVAQVIPPAALGHEPRALLQLLEDPRTANLLRKWWSLQQREEKNEELVSSTQEAEKTGAMLKEAQWGFLGRLLGRAGAGVMRGASRPLLRLGREGLRAEARAFLPVGGRLPMGLVRSGHALSRGAGALERGAAKIVSPWEKMMARRPAQQAASVTARAAQVGEPALAARAARGGLGPEAIRGQFPVLSVAQRNAEVAARSPLARMAPSAPRPVAAGFGPGQVQAGPGTQVTGGEWAQRQQAMAAQRPPPPPVPETTAAGRGFSGGARIDEGEWARRQAQPPTPTPTAPGTSPGAPAAKPGVMDIARNYFNPEAWSKAWDAPGTKLMTAGMMGMGMLQGQSMPAAAIGALAPLPFARAGTIPFIGASMLAGNLADRMFPGVPPAPPPEAPQPQQVASYAGY